MFSFGNQNNTHHVGRPNGGKSYCFFQNSSRIYSQTELREVVYYGSLDHIMSSYYSTKYQVFTFDMWHYKIYVLREINLFIYSIEDIRIKL